MEQLFLKEDKNLLAFSAGIDSTALFFMLLEKNINFDIAIVNYGLRAQAKDEISYAKDLAKKYNKQIYIKNYDKNKFNEKLARDFRYEFFENLIKENSYTNLITAHQLNDKLEWFLMQFTKGAGVTELIAFDEIEQRQNYKLIRPILDKSKEELLEYLKTNNIKYFIDETNIDPKYKRNYFRAEFSNRLLSEFKDGIKNSFTYIQNDIDSLNNLSKLIYKNQALSIYEFSGDKNIAIKIIDKELKQRGLIISKATRDEILEQNEIIISAKIAVAISENKIWITNVSKNSMDKKFKEFCRINKIPKNIRTYLSELFKSPEEIKKSLQEVLFS